MPLSQGRHYLAIPGPSVIPDRVLQAMHRPAPNIYEGELVELTESIIPDLKHVAGTAGQATIYIGNGHAAWEAALANILSRGDHILVLVTGRFGAGWAQMAESLGAQVETMDFGKQSPIDLDQVAQRLAQDRGHSIKAVLCVHVDTATSVRNDIAGLRRVMDAAGHPALLGVDCIASLACDEFHMDDWGVDVMVAACQKGLMVPPGLGFVFFNDKADKARERANCVTAYWDWRPRAFPEVFYQYFCGTSPCHHLYGLRAALDMMMDEGMPHIWQRHAQIARAIWAAFDTWGSGGGEPQMNIADSAHRSHAVTALRMAPPNGTALRDWVDQNTGLTLGIGLGMAPMGDPAGHGFFRIGHMGHVNGQMILGALGAIEAGLCALDIPHTPGGVAAAAKTIAAMA
jgi:alanine-glyoxylate transaminase/serine-glyoxylate transaminase/serine-pyruvate transaminase